MQSSTKTGKKPTAYFFCLAKDMITAGTIHQKLRDISKLFISGEPPIHIEGLAQDLQIPAEELKLHLSELEAKGDIKMEDDLIILTDQGAQEIG